jgi:undecaprenyl-diphosphatase
MVLIPILGAALLDVKDVITGEVVSGLGAGVLIIGFVAAFLTGYAACRWMLDIVKKQKLIYFSIYCCIIGLFALLYGLLGG